MSTVTVDRKQLVEALGKVKPAVTRQGKLPVLSGVKLTARPEGLLSVQATDLELWITTAVRADSAARGEMVLPFLVLQKYLAKSTEPTLTLDLTGDELTVTANGSSGSFVTMPTADWPRLTEPSGDLVPLTPTVVDAIGRVARFASPEDSRPILCGVAFDGDAVVTTDSYRLAVVTGLGKLPKTLLPAAALARAVKDAGPMGSLEVDELRALVAGTDGTATVLTCIRGEYPKWRQLSVNVAPTTTVTVDRKAVIAALKRLEPWTDFVKPLRIKQHGDALSLSVVSQSESTITEKIAATGSLGEWTLGLNARYLREGMEACSEDTVTLEITDNLKPVRIAEGTFAYLLMPVRIEHYRD